MASWFPEEGGQTPVCTLHELGPVSNHLYVAHTFPHPTQPSCNVFPLPRPPIPTTLTSLFLQGSELRPRPTQSLHTRLFLLVS